MSAARVQKKHWLIEITPADIAQGKPMTVSLCPVALAMQRGIQSECKIAVQSCGIRVWFSSGGDYLWQPSRKLCRWMHRFDTGRQVEPGRFVLSIPKVG